MKSFLLRMMGFKPGGVFTVGEGTEDLVAFQATKPHDDKLPAYVLGTHGNDLWRVAPHGDGSVHLLSVKGLERVYSVSEFWRAINCGSYTIQTP